MEVILLLRSDDAGAQHAADLNVNNDNNAIYDLQWMTGNAAIASVGGA